MNENEIKTPCFVLDLDKSQDNIQRFRGALSSRFSNYVLGYSIKTNSTPILLDIIKNNGCFAEVVSYTEYNLALAVGFPPTNIVYNGPLKDKQTFIHAITNGAYVNIDTKRELSWLCDLPKDKIYNIGLRVNLNLKQISPEDCKEGEEYSRFGFSDEHGELFEAINVIKSFSNIRLAGLHLHRTSKTRSLDVYRNIANYAIEIVKKYSLNLDYIDAGGGYYGDMPGKPTYQDYVNIIADTLSQYLDCSKLVLIVEPGNAIIASPYSFYSSVIDTKRIKDNNIVVIDGSRNDIDPFFHKKDYFKTFVTQMTERSTINKQVIVGCTCLENDRLFEIDNHAQLKVGDIIKFHFVGAYTTCISPLFIRYFPRVYIQKDSKYELVHEEWTPKEYLQS